MVIGQEGVLADKFFIVQSGCVRVLREILVDAEGQVSLQTAGRNSVQGRSAASRRKDRKEGVRRLVKVGSGWGGES